MIGDDVRIGFAAEIKQALIGDGVSIGPMCFVADSRIDDERLSRRASSHVQPSARRAPISVRMAITMIDTGRDKLGCWIGAGASLGIQVIVLPGRVIAPGSLFEPRMTVDRNYPAGRYRPKQTSKHLEGNPHDPEHHPPERSCRGGKPRASRRRLRAGCADPRLGTKQSVELSAETQDFSKGYGSLRSVKLEYRVDFADTTVTFSPTVGERRVSGSGVTAVGFAATSITIGPTRCPPAPARSSRRIGRCSPMSTWRRMSASSSPTRPWRRSAGAGRAISAVRTSISSRAGCGNISRAARSLIA